jgi:cyclohexanone monooxygenase
MYLPLLEHSDYMPSERDVRGGEIFDDTRKLAKDNDIHTRALFPTRVQDVAWNETDRQWTVATDRGDALRARYVVMATGGLLHRPKLPAIPGFEDFQGHSFVTSRWDFDYTGGDSTGSLDNLRDKRVAVIGTGATAIQVVPEAAQYAEHLYVIQRTPTIVDERSNRPTDADWWAENNKPGWIQSRRESFESNIFGLPNDGDLVQDQWTQIWGLPSFEMPADGSAPDMADIMAQMSAYDDEQMDRIRQRIDDIVTDPVTAEALKPYYTAHCKRSCFSDLYLPAFNHPNVTLVDTQGLGIDEITADSIRVGSATYEVDLIIFATGFEVAVSPGRSGGFDVRGVVAGRHQRARPRHRHRRVHAPDATPGARRLPRPLRASRRHEGIPTRPRASES